jgi:PA domain
VVWDGANVTDHVPDVLSFGSPEVQVTTPAAIAGPYQFGTAGFGPPIGSPDVSSTVVPAVDAVEVGGAATDGCSPFDNAGATAVIIYNNAANVNAAPPRMGDDGINGAFVTIPAVSLRRADGLAILGEIGAGVSAFIGVDPHVRAGADDSGRARVYAPFPVVGGSSISHYDTVARRNLLMEPAINADLTHRVKAPFDLTYERLSDVGWTFPDADADGVADDEDCNPPLDPHTHDRDRDDQHGGAGAGSTRPSPSRSSFGPPR